MVVVLSTAAPPAWQNPYAPRPPEVLLQTSRPGPLLAELSPKRTEPGLQDVPVEAQVALASLDVGVPLPASSGRREPSLAALPPDEPAGSGARGDLTSLPLEAREVVWPPVGTKPVRSMIEMRHAGVVLQKWDISCGAAALATVLNYQHGFPVTELEIADEMLGQADTELVRSRGGFSLLDLKQYVQAHGFAGAGYADLTIENLEAFGPTIVPIWVNALPHFVVVRGRIGDRVILADPAYGNRTMPVDRFEQVWESRIGFVVTRADGSMPETQLAALPQDYIVPSGDMVRSALGGR